MCTNSIHCQHCVFQATKKNVHLENTLRPSGYNATKIFRNLLAHHSFVIAFTSMQPLYQRDWIAYLQITLKHNKCSAYFSCIKYIYCREMLCSCIRFESIIHFLVCWIFVSVFVCLFSFNSIRQIQANAVSLCFIYSISRHCFSFYFFFFLCTSCIECVYDIWISFVSKVYQCLLWRTWLNQSFDPARHISHREIFQTHEQQQQQSKNEERQNEKPMHSFIRRALYQGTKCLVMQVSYCIGILLTGCKNDINMTK